MQEPASIYDGIAFHSSEAIQSHPRFAEARMVLIEKDLALYEHDRFMTRLLQGAGRVTLFFTIICLHAGYIEADRATWPTIRRLLDILGSYQLSSPRRLEALIPRLVETGYLKLLPSPHDRRVRILTPTDKMLDHDLDWLVVHYAPLDHLFPTPGYARIMQRDPIFQVAQRVAAAAHFQAAARILSSYPAVMLFLNREAGTMVLVKLLQLAGSNPDGGSEGLSYADIGERFGVSRTHVRSLLQDAEQAGLVRLSGRGGQLVQLMPGLITEFDRFLADGMSMHDLIYKMALRQLSASPRGSE